MFIVPGRAIEELMGQEVTVNGNGKEKEKSQTL
jgi:hypothetical protein